MCQNAHRGFIAAWPQFGAPAGLLLATLAMLAFSAILGDHLRWYSASLGFSLKSGEENGIEIVFPELRLLADGSRENTHRTAG
jgi:hypothetical protein